ncbi:hypothetical protein RRG08_067171 [Elysia crispata]|uniref:Angiotensin-converting enzyme n=1 Tax=Elysia crispata TaxID=231223 RepID=A0AAE1A7G6_9GAST|nr:hypothetical protein RRG08_067171 [Elysia crispata]
MAAQRVETPAQILEKYERETLPKWNMVSEAGWQQKTNVTDKNMAIFLQTVISEMEQIYSKAEVCMNPSGDCLKLEPGLAELMRSSRDCQNLSDAWRGWRDQSGKKMKDMYQEYVQLSNENVQILGKGYTTKKMFQTAEDFFYSLGLDNMTQIFWEKSMLERPEGREVVCHPSAWDMKKQDDFRIKMCTTINHAFHEAVGDTIALSVQTPSHLKSIGLLKAGDEQDKEADLNFLMLMALEKIAFLPFGYLIDQWRWSVFRGDTPPEQYNNEWWHLRCRLQGISPAVKRGADDFDPAAKYHVVANFAYIQYFVSFVLQFQFYKAACVAAGYTGPLYKCDFYNNKAAGEKFKSMLQLGSSLPWPEAMERMTGQRHMDAGPLVEYFEPLLDFLRKENGDDYGWEEKCPENPPPCNARTTKLDTSLWTVSFRASG